MQASVFEGEDLVTVQEVKTGGERLEISVPQPKPWSPGSPHLYDLVVEAGEDRVRRAISGCVSSAWGRTAWVARACA